MAIDELLDAAGRAFAEFGVAKATMIDVARFAGCSRATLYRYFPNQAELHLAFVHRATLRIAVRIAAGHGPGLSVSLTDRILSGIREVRADPMLAIWFEPENMAVPIAVSQSSDLLRSMSVNAIGETVLTNQEREEIERRGEWLLRSIVMLLAMPGKDDAAERAIVESFIVPALLAEPVPVVKPS